MGGHGGLNILPQKRWNVYNFDNREKVKQDEEAAAKEEQLKREQSRKRDAEFRLEQLRTARGLAPLHRPGSSQAGQDANSQEAEPQSESMPESELQPESRSLSNHINLFEGIKIFDPVSGGGEGKRKRKSEEEEKGGASKKMKKKEDPPRTVGPEDEKYRLGYGIAGKGVKLPWYMSKPSDNDSKSDRNNSDGKSRTVKEKSKSSGRKTLEELREERWRREKKEKERERALIVEKRSSRRDGRSGSNKSDYSRRKPSF